jgi:hypothetical protein
MFIDVIAHNHIHRLILKREAHGIPHQEIDPRRWGVGSSVSHSLLVNIQTDREHKVFSEERGNDSTGASDIEARQRPDIRLKVLNDA